MKQCQNRPRNKEILVILIDVNAKYLGYQSDKNRKILQDTNCFVLSRIVDKICYYIT